MAVKNDYLVIGIMSGTSLDGLDICLSEFHYTDKGWIFKIKDAITLAYGNELRDKLAQCHMYSAMEFLMFENEYGKFIADSIKAFLKNNKLQIDFIASHGHTIFHQPDKGFTCQIGSGAVISAITGIVTISDFRTLDVALGGQGAPLVPIGDEMLFSDYDYCLNLGGFANVSYEKSYSRIAFDICPVNIFINYMMQKNGKEYDMDGETARSGKIIPLFLDELNKLDFYRQPAPKSLGREWVEKKIYPLIENSVLPVEDILRTYYEHISFQISRIIGEKASADILVTGGGAHNTYLLELIQKKISGKITIPDDKIIDYKEALIFGFLGVLRHRNEVNCLSSVTGARSDSSGGIIYNYHI